MKNSAIDNLIDRVVAAKMAAIDRWIDEVIDDLEKFGNPEKLIGKPYEDWTPEDLMVLGQVYGKELGTPLDKLLGKKALEHLNALEREVGTHHG